MSPQTVHQFAEKVALISDASNPIGRAVAMQLALQGSYVIGLFPSAMNDADAYVGELVELGTLAHAVAADPATPEGSGYAAAEVNRLFGRLDLLVNCLKFRPESSFETMTGEVFTETVVRNLGSAYFLTQAVFGLMEGRPKPKIVNLAAALEGTAEPIFQVTQSAVAELTRSFADLFPKKFRVNCVEVKEAQISEPQENALFRSPTAVASDDAARAVLFLLSPESTAMNGKVLKLG